MLQPPVLTARQTNFVAAYLVDGNGTQAAIRAGYSPTSARQIATRMMSKASIRAAVAEGQGHSAKQLQIERLDVIKGLLEAVEMAKENGEPAVMVRGLAELAKLLGFYAPELHRIQATPSLLAEQGRYEAMSDAELLRLAAAAR